MAEIGNDIERAADLLTHSELVAIPTETVYGLAGNGMDASAVSEIFRVKERPAFDPLILHTSSVDRIQDFASEINDVALELAKNFWPGPLTLILPKKENVPYLVSSGLETIGVRIPDHSLTLELLESIDFPLAAPSANPFGYISPTTPDHVNDQLGEKISYILDGGPCRVGIESTIIGFEENKPVIYRMGGIEVERITDLIGPVRVMDNSSSDPKSPGMLKSHYAPRKKIRMGKPSEMILDYDPEEVSVIVFTNALKSVPFEQQFVLSEEGNLNEAAQNLFNALRILDNNDTRLILAEYLPDTGLGRAINDRLKRASN